jgi:spermidine/putrescine-binding protein
LGIQTTALLASFQVCFKPADTMLITALIIAAGSTAAFAAGSGSLRGTTKTNHNNAYGQMEADVRTAEQVLASFVEDLPAVIENAKNSLSKADLEYAGGNPMLTYDNFIVVKKYDSKQCHGEGKQI